jgi:hypothetical protein
MGFAFAAMLATLLIARYAPKSTPESEITGSELRETSEGIGTTTAQRENVPVQIREEDRLAGDAPEEIPTGGRQPAAVPANVAASTQSGFNHRIEPLKRLPVNRLLVPAAASSPQMALLPVVTATPDFEMDAAAEVARDDDRDAEVYGVLGMQRTDMTLSAPVPAEESQRDIPEESSFNEIMWIVQQSTSLDEKRNIWLSYIGRETVDTYRSLGVYHLALVLSQIAEQTRSTEKAGKAAEFFEANQIILRQLLGDDRFNRKVATLRTIMERS